MYDRSLNTEYFVFILFIDFISQLFLILLCTFVAVRVIDKDREVFWGVKIS